MVTTIANVGTALLQECGYVQDATNIAVTPAMVLAENGYLAATSNVAVTAALVLEENNYTTPAAATVEYLIDNAVNYINMQANTSMAALAGAPGAMTQNYDRNEATILKSLAALMIKAYKDRSPNVSLGGITAATVLADPQYALHSDIIKAGISRLQTLSTTNVGYLIDNAIGYVNAQTGAQMSLLAAGTVTLEGSQAAVVKLIAGILLKVALSRGGDVSLQTVTKDPQHSMYAQMIADAIKGLQTIKADYVEEMLDDAIRYVNSEAGTSIAALTGGVGTKSLVGSDAEVVVVKSLGKIMLRDALGQKTSAMHRQIVESTIQRLRGRTMLRA